MSIFVRARFEIRDGRRAGFEAAVLALREQAAGESGTLTYRFFSAGEDSYVVLEEYADSAAAIMHNERAAELLRRVRECAEMSAIEFYGPVWPEIREWIDTVPIATAYPEYPAAEE